jgi:hypothetical protein
VKNKVVEHNGTVSPILSARFEKVMKMSNFVQKTINALMTIRYLREVRPRLHKIRLDIGCIYYLSAPPGLCGRTFSHFFGNIAAVGGKGRGFSLAVKPG